MTKRDHHSHAWICFLIAAIVCEASAARADDCNLAAHFGPVSFDNERPVAALRKILTGTGISLVESGEFNAGTISAQNVSGTVGEAVRRLAEGTGLVYTCSNGVMRVSQKPHPAAAAGTTDHTDLAAAPMKAVPVKPAAPPPPPTQAIIRISDGDSIRARLTEFAKANHYRVSWSGDDLFAKKSADFVGNSFEDVVNKFLIATKITGYITKDEGKTLNVFVQ